MYTNFVLLYLYKKKLKIAWQPTINLKIRKSKNITDVYLDNEMWFTHKIFYFDHYIYNCLKHIYVYTNMRKTCYYKTYLIQTLSYNKFTTNSMHTYTHTQSHTQTHIHRLTMHSTLKLFCFYFPWILKSKNTSFLLYNCLWNQSINH